MLLKAKTHINTIGKIWVITPHGARQKFGMLMFMHEMTSSLLPDHLTPLPCLISRMNLLGHPFPILSSPFHSYAPTAPSRYASDTSTQSFPSPLLTPLHHCHLPSLLSCRTLKICPGCCHPISTLTTPYASAPLPLTMLTQLPRPQDMPLTPPPDLCRLPCLWACIRTVTVTL
ncbi:hypothetical protein O181_129723 [Austropuccinia psidii MF-1]|uniref:Uncharacterized protein n=1 Tax=Austropuccinia psidii MF-1 TaxID=1389203 RepID=A0A9Q3KX99_9BASI|nr:hypothetical protein [Austropuccinia psidii MF-1]